MFQLNIFRVIIKEKTIRIVFSFITSIIFSSLTAQTYYFDTYGAVEGASSKIYCLLQDHNQNVWLGTPAGVSKFDGKYFENFTSEDGLAPQAVRTIFQDKNNTIWFGHAGGRISVLKDNIFFTFEKLDSLIKGNITSIFQDSNSNIWITTQSSGAYILSDPFSEKPMHFQHFMGKNKLSDRVFNYCQTAD